MHSRAYYLLLDRIHILGANAISSPITYGFPAITGFLGSIHALSRKIAAENKEIMLDGVLIACHDCNVKSYRPHEFSDFTFVQSRNPIKKNGETASIIEEGKADVVVSLLIEVKSTREGRRWLDDNQLEFIEWINEQILKQRIAGGSVQSVQDISLFSRNTPDEEIISHLLPAFVLNDAKNDMTEILNELQATQPSACALDVLLSVSTLRHIPEKDKSENIVWKTKSVKSGRGWLVPIPVGFQGIAPLFEPGELMNCRSLEYPSHYTECIYGLGKWVFPYRIESIAKSLWRYDHVKPNLYIVTQNSH